MKLLLSIPLMLAVSVANAEIYKCAKDGKFEFQDHPCDFVGTEAKAKADSPMLRPDWAYRAREYTIPGHGRLALSVPQTLKDLDDPHTEPPSNKMLFTPLVDTSFVVEVTTVWVDDQAKASLTPAAVKGGLSKEAGWALYNVPNKLAPVRDLRGLETVGCYYELPTRGEYQFLLKGSLVTGNLATVFMIRSHNSAFPERAAILNMLADAKYLK
jgi:hypothetical protein